MEKFKGAQPSEVEMTYINGRKAFTVLKCNTEAEQKAYFDSLKKGKRADQ